MDVGPLSKRLKVVESGSKKNAIQQNPKFIDESAYVVQLFHALGYDEVSKTVIDTICNLIKEWLSLITTPLTIKGKYYLPYTVRIIFTILGVVSTSTVSFLLGNILSLL